MSAKLIAGVLALASVLSSPVGTAAVMPAGKALFEQRCAVCHGDHGRGGVGVPLALPSFLSRVSNHYLATTIELGRPGRVMPSFRSLNKAQIQAIVQYIRSWSPEGAPPVFSDQHIQGDSIRGRRVFAERCAACHGVDGRGGRGTGVTFSRPRNMPIIAPALNNPGFLAAASDAMIKRTLIRGRQGTPMVSAKQMGLTPVDVDDVVSYIRSLQKKQTRGAAQSVSKEPAVLVYDSPYDLQQTVLNIQRAAVGRNFRLIRTQDLDYGFVPAARENRHQVIVYFCDFDFLYKAMALDPRVGLFLPCRITVVQSPDGKVKVMSINPKRLSHLYNNAELDRDCARMYRLYKDIMEEATL